MRLCSAALCAIAFSLCFASQSAAAAGVGFSLPKARVLTLDGSTSLGASVQVIGGAFSIGTARLDLGLDYALTRDFGAGANYAFLDALAGLGLPLTLSSSLYVTPALDLHVIGFAATPQGVDKPVFGIAPRLTLGYRPSSQLAVELGTSYNFLFGVSAAGRSLTGTMLAIELGGTYSF
jgi:hypothetical protein